MPTCRRDLAVFKERDLHPTAQTPPFSEPAIVEPEVEVVETVPPPRAGEIVRIDRIHVQEDLRLDVFRYALLLRVDQGVVEEVHVEDGADRRRASCDPIRQKLGRRHDPVYEYRVVPQSIGAGRDRLDELEPPGVLVDQSRSQIFDFPCMITPQVSGSLVESNGVKPLRGRRTRTSRRRYRYDYEEAADPIEWLEPLMPGIGGWRCSASASARS